MKKKAQTLFVVEDKPFNNHTHDRHHNRIGYFLNSDKQQNSRK